MNSVEKYAVRYGRLPPLLTRAGAGRARRPLLLSFLAWCSDLYESTRAIHLQK